MHLQIPIKRSGHSQVIQMHSLFKIMEKDVRIDELFIFHVSLCTSTRPLKAQSKVA